MKRGILAENSGRYNWKWSDRKDTKKSEGLWLEQINQ